MVWTKKLSQVSPPPPLASFQTNRLSVFVTLCRLSWLTRARFVCRTVSCAAATVKERTSCGRRVEATCCCCCGDMWENTTNGIYTTYPHTEHYLPCNSAGDSALLCAVCTALRQQNRTTKQPPFKPPPSSTCQPMEPAINFRFGNCNLNFSGSLHYGPAD